MKPLVTARVAFEDENLLGRELADTSWLAMRALILAALGEKLTGEERKLFVKLTLREQEPFQRVKRLLIVAGRRSGKSRTAAALILYLALLCDHSGNLSIGEKGVVLCVAQNMDQAKVVFNYCVGILNAQPILKKEVVSITREAIVLRNGIEIQVRPASFRGLRGITCVAAICDETAFWFTEEGNSSNPDTEIINAITPALATTKGMLIIISSPYSRRGVVWKFYSKHFGPCGDPMTLVAQGASRDFNPTIDEEEVRAALEEDFGVAQSEWLGQFRNDLQNFVSADAVKVCVIPGRYELLPRACGTYTCFADASTGTGGDSFAAAIGHLRGETLVVDAIRNYQPKFSPQSVVCEICDLCKRYQITTIYSDAYASGFVAELISKNGLSHEIVQHNKSQLYTNLLSVINSQKIELLDDPRTLQELINLERRTGFAGRDRIDHPPGCHDDSANAVAGLAQVAIAGGNFDLMTYYRAWSIPGTEPWKWVQEQERLMREEEEQAAAARERKAQ